MIQPDKTLLIGNGTLSSVPKVYPLSGEVTSVELDGGVLEAGKRHFTRPETLEGLERWRLYVDDGKHFLRDNDQSYDLVVIDVPSPLTIQEAFPEVMVIYSHKADRGFAYASKDLPFSAQEVRNQAKSYETKRIKVIKPNQVDAYLKKAVPLSVNAMDLVLRRGWERFADRYFED